MIEIRVLEFDRLGKAYVVDPKTLNVYETESIKGNPYCMYEKKGERMFAAGFVTCLLVLCHIYKLLLTSKILAIILYILLLLGAVGVTGFTSYKDKYFFDLKDLKSIDKYRNKFLISNFVKNILEENEKMYYEGIVISIVIVVLILFFLFIKDYQSVLFFLLLFVMDVSALLYQKEWRRRKILKRLLASLEQE